MPKSRIACALVAATVLVLPSSAFAQEVGIKAGINFASLTPEEDEDPDDRRRRGPIAGVWVRSGLTTHLSVQVEGLFSEKGVVVDVTALGLDGDADVRFRYLEFPVLARGDFSGQASTTRVYVVGGVAPAFALSARGTASFNGEEQTQDLDRATEPFDLGLVAGIGVEFRRAQIEARYTHGLLRTNEDDNDPNDRIENRVFSVTFGFRLR